MKSLDEGGTSLLDNSMIMFGGSLKDGNRHAVANLPLILAGRGKGTLRPGRRLRAPEQTPLCNLYLSLLSRMGIEEKSFGDSTGRARGSVVVRTLLRSWRSLAPARRFAADPAAGVHADRSGRCSCRIAAPATIRNSRNPANFLKAATAKDMEADRGLWRSVAAQLRNRTMPPVASKLSEADRLRVSHWVETQLRQTACSAGDYAGAGSVARASTAASIATPIRDLLGVDLDFTSLFPADGTGGAGFDTNGETLYIPPLLMEQYLEAAQQILDRVIVTPRSGPHASPAARPAIVAIYLDGDYDVRVALDQGRRGASFAVKVDGADAGATRAAAAGAEDAAPVRRSPPQIRLERGTHEISIAGDVRPRPHGPSKSGGPIRRRKSARCTTASSASEPGEDPLQPRKAAQQVLASFLPKSLPPAGRPRRSRSLPRPLRPRRRARRPL